jgi:hypothetical protein
MIIGAIIGAVIIGWAIVGGVSYHSSGASSAPASGASRPDCTFCVQLDAWWSSLGFWGRLAGAAWYAAQKLGCAIKGC